MTIRLHTTILATLLLCAACSEDDPAPAEADAAPVTSVDAALPDATAPASGVVATVSYTGTSQGQLVLAAFTSFPPAGGPVGLAQNPTPSFPATLTLPDLAPGEYHVLALLDAPPASPTQPGPEDRQAWSGAITVVDGEALAVELTLVDAP